MESVDVHQAETNLSQLIERVLNGEEIIICRAGMPVARLTGLAQKRDRRILGLMKGKIRFGDDFDDPLPGGGL